MSEPTQEIVRVAAAAGPRIRVAVLQQVAEADPRSLYAALREAVDGHVLLPIGEGQGDQYVFRHALLQEASYGDLLPGERTRLHAAYAQALGGDLQSDLVVPRRRSLPTTGTRHMTFREPSRRPFGRGLLRRR